MTLTIVARIIGALIGCALWIFWISRWVDLSAWRIFSYIMCILICTSTYNTIRRDLQNAPPR